MKNSYLITTIVIVLIGALFFFRENKSHIKTDEVKTDKIQLKKDNNIFSKNNLELQSNMPLNKDNIYKTENNYNNLEPIYLSGNNIESKKDNNISLKNNIELQSNIALNKVIIYKTKDNYNNLVPISLSEDKETIISYPNMKDLTSSSEPTLLKSNYLLDNRGINKNSVFLNMTYNEYRALTDTLSLENLKLRIKDNNPFLEMYICPKIKNITEQVEYINSLIESQSLKKDCVVLI